VLLACRHPHALKGPGTLAPPAYRSRRSFRTQAPWQCQARCWPTGAYATCLDPATLPAPAAPPCWRRWSPVPARPVRTRAICPDPGALPAPAAPPCWRCWPTEANAISPGPEPGGAGRAALLALPVHRNPRGLISPGHPAGADRAAWLAPLAHRCPRHLTGPGHLAGASRAALLATDARATSPDPATLPAPAAPPCWRRWPPVPARPRRTRAPYRRRPLRLAGAAGPPESSRPLRTRNPAGAGRAALLALLAHRNPCRLTGPEYPTDAGRAAGAAGPPAPAQLHRPRPLC
jgi:hypothetical protein